MVHIDTQSLTGLRGLGAMHVGRGPLLYLLAATHQSEFGLHSLISLAYDQSDLLIVSLYLIMCLFLDCVDISDCFWWLFGCVCACACAFILVFVVHRALI